MLVLAGKKEYAAMRQSAANLGAALPQATVRLIDLGESSSLAQEHNGCLYAPDKFS